MISNLLVTEFRPVPHLASSQLMTLHKCALTFPQDKPLVVVGPNGAGKSALLTALAMRTLSFMTGESELDAGYLSNNNEDFWHRTREWGNDYEFLKGLTVDTDNAPALYYRPGHIPGNIGGVTESMMSGYFDRVSGFDCVAG